MITNLATASSIVKRLQDLGYIAYFAGGWVRDYLLGFPSSDIDIATNASIEVLQAVFEKTLPVGAAFGIVIVVEEGHQFEIATFRKEQEYLDGRRPSRVESCSAEEDAKRRDFTINGLFYDPIKKEIFDYIGGKQDLHLKLIRAIGNPIDRLKEDKLRMLRAIRYSTRFGFQIEKKTQEAIEAIAPELFPAVSKERIYQELQKMDLYDTLSDSLRLLLKHRLLKVIFEELCHDEEHHILSRIARIDELPKKTPLIAKLSCLFHLHPVEMKLQALEKLKISKKESLLIAYLDELEKALSSSLMDDYSLALLYSRNFFSIGINFYKHLKETRKEALHLEKHAESLKPFIERITHKNPVITSHDLMTFGIDQGPLLGTLLKEAEKLSINEKILDKERLLTRLKRSPIWPFKQ